MIRFGPFQVDPRTWTLSRDGAAVDLSPRLVEILGYLAARGGDIVTKEELLDRFWPGVNITDNTLTRAVADIRKALGDDAGHPIYLQTAARRGYRFVGESTTVAAGSRAQPVTSPDGQARTRRLNFARQAKIRSRRGSRDGSRSIRSTSIGCRAR